MDASAAAPVSSPVSAPPQPERATAGNWRPAVVAAFWLLVFGWFWLGAPTPGKLLGGAWFLLGALWPMGWFYSFALALPWFGNNPGGAHMLWLVDLGLMGLVVRHFWDRSRGGVAYRPSRLDPWVLLFVVWSWIMLIPQWRHIRSELLNDPLHFLPIIFNHYGTADVYGMQVALKLALAAAMFGVVRDRPWHSTQIGRMRLLLLAGVIFSALVGWLKYFEWINLSWWRGENPETSRFGFTRLQSLYWHAGWFAQYLIALTPGVLALAWPPRRSVWRWLGLAATAGLSVTVLFTMARAAWLGLAGGCAVVLIAAFIRSGQRAVRALGLTLAALAGVAMLAFLLALLHPELRHRISELGVYQHRTQIWAGAVGMIRERPLTGWGFGNYEETHTFLFPEGHPYFDLPFKVDAHNHLLHTWAERGLIGVLLHLAILVFIFWSLGRAAFGRTPLRETVPGWLPLAALGGLTALLIDGLFQYLFYIRVIELLFWLFAGWSAWCEPAPLLPRHTRRWAWIVIALLLAVGIWKHLGYLEPYRFALEGWRLYVGKKEVRIFLPADTRTVDLVLGSYDPSAADRPVTFTISMGSEFMKAVEFKGQNTRRIKLELAAGHAGRGPLTITADRTWSPWGGWGIRWIPFTEMGVLYLIPEPGEKQVIPSPD